jgi:endonuclease YncB( thermonuclease family)
MVRDGFARRYVRFDKAGEFTDTEREARERRRGLWADPNPVPLWE